MPDPTPTLGEQRVRLGFNPSERPAVARIKHAGAALIDAVHEAEGDPRLKALAMTDAESAAMWGVKAVTTEHPTSSMAAGSPADPAGGNAGGDPGRIADLERQVASLDEQLATCRRERDAFAGQATARDQTIDELRLELEQRGPR